MKKKSRKFGIFLFCGGLAACANVISRWLLSFWLPYPAAIVAAYMIGMLTGFLLFKFFVFNSRNSKRVFRETVWYTVVNIFALLQTLVISIVLADHVFPWLNMDFHPHDIAHCMGVGIPVISSYLGHNFFTFKSRDISCV